MGRIESTTVAAFNSYGQKISKLGALRNNETDCLLLLWFLNYMATESDSSLRFCENAEMFVQDSDTMNLINRIYDNVKDCLAEKSCLVWPDACTCAGESHPQWHFDMSLDIRGSVIIANDGAWLVTDSDGNTIMVSDISPVNKPIDSDTSDDDTESNETKLLNLLRSLGFVTSEDITVPTRTSELTNDSGYITQEDIPEIPEVPTNVSELNNDAGYISSYTETDPEFNAWDKDYNDLTNKPTLTTVTFKYW